MTPRKQHSPIQLSVIVPLYNEEEVIDSFHADVLKNIDKVTPNFELIYVSDGSTDNTKDKIRRMAATDKKVKLIVFSRNFGKESALTAGLHVASGRAIIMMDGDGQHPSKYIKKFYEKWEDGDRVVVGVRNNNGELGFIKSKTSALFHKIINLLTDKELVYGTTDYRLIDSTVKDELLQLPETNRVMRAMIDWLGFQPTYIEFKVAKRYQGKSSFTTKSLFQHAANSFASITPRPLYIIGYLGLAITAFSLVFGLVVFIEQLVIGDPLNWNFTGTAMLAILIIFLVGLLLTAQGILSLYISHMHNQTLRRPLYIIDRQKSFGIDK